MKLELDLVVKTLHNPEELSSYTGGGIYGCFRTVTG